jgi:hypothetical protein
VLAQRRDSAADRAVQLSMSFALPKDESPEVGNPVFGGVSVQRGPLCQHPWQWIPQLLAGFRVEPCLKCFTLCSAICGRFEKNHKRLAASGGRGVAAWQQPCCSVDSIHCGRHTS